MTIIPPSIFYIHFKTLKRVLYLNLVKHFSLKRALFTFAFLLLYAHLVVFLMVGRLLDEILFYGYRKTEIKNPVFIISNPRSGTTFLHRLFALDGDNYTYTMLYHTIFPCITYIKIFRGLAYIDDKIGKPMQWVVSKLNDLFFGGWKDVHPMGFNKPEEDENFFMLMIYTPALLLLTPFTNELEKIDFLDQLDDETKHKMKAFYMNSLQRFVYATNPNATLLMKNVFSTGRIDWLLSCFPDAKIVYPVRNPYKAVPSVISMFTGPWKLHSPEIHDKSIQTKFFGNIAVSYYKYFDEKRKSVSPENFIWVKYEEVVANPYDTIAKIYGHFGLNISPEYSEKLKNYVLHKKSYKSKHSYSLEQYNFTKAEIYNALQNVFELFNFEPQLEE